jgi:hypothetical protein
MIATELTEFSFSVSSVADNINTDSYRFILDAIYMDSALKRC